MRKKWIICVIVALAVASSYAADVKVKYSGPSGQGDIIYWDPVTGVTNLVMTSTGLKAVTMGGTFVVSTNTGGIYLGGTFVAPTSSLPRDSGGTYLGGTFTSPTNTAQVASGGTYTGGTFTSPTNTAMVTDGRYAIVGSDATTLLTFQSWTNVIAGGTNMHTFSPVFTATPIAIVVQYATDPGDRTNRIYSATGNWASNQCLVEADANVIYTGIAIGAK